MSVPPAIAELRDPRTIRARCEQILAAGLRGELRHFAVDLDKLRAVAHFTAEVTLERYPTREVPEHGRMTHFDAGGVARAQQLMAALGGHDKLEQARRLIDVVLVSVLLDAGAGTAWHFTEPGTNLRLGRSEGLAVASLAWVRGGALSSRGEPYVVDAAGLLAMDEAGFTRAFQLTPENPLVGVAGRIELLHGLGRALGAHPEVFGPAARPGGLVDHCLRHAVSGVIPAPFVLATLLDHLSGIWPGRLALEGIQLGDVWSHAAAGGTGPSAGLVPFHKLTQWLTYSLLQPLRIGGLELSRIPELTGLAEYRNGGLFVDMGVLIPKYPAVTADAHEVGSELVVEWRALTLALLDRLAPLVRSELGLKEDRLPLAAVLEGGSWAAGRRVAAQRRRDAMPPIRVISDGTVF